MQNNLFNELEKKTNVKQEDLFTLANSVSNADLTDENTVRQLIAQVSQLANVPVSKEKEEQLIDAIIHNEVPLDFGTLAKMFAEK
ncbi:stage VI sporulation protein F [Desertibacillus haloalkaliphilus]|uniref:stage VI sporulation protein F n=1 Tax=Desertibacillus haloalkaliphilus TaxID=1328930 RepID=UPI001C25BDFB|nr:stage VI sporulation protein F [Desertibacillus haloalkaliphilus]MBU8907231.1 stage VI sporulation protein F [Desertibacillus haloalkaliphilus]